MLVSRISNGILRLFVGLLALFLVSTCLVVAALRWLDPPTSAFILSAARGHEITQPLWTDWERMSPWLAIAVVAAEDQRFPSHHGFDLTEIGNAIAEAMHGGRVRGASTITQQLAKNLFLWSGRSWVRKGLEAYFTVLLELFLSKKRILELYLNVAEFGPRLFGAGTAAATYFSKSAAELSLLDASLLAAALPSPRTANPGRPDRELRHRAEQVRRQVAALGGLAYLKGIDRDG